MGLGVVLFLLWVATQFSSVYLLRRWSPEGDRPVCTCFIFYVAMDGRNNEEKKIWIVWCVFLWVFSQLTNHKPQAFSSCVVRRLVDPFLPSCHIGSYPMFPWVCYICMYVCMGVFPAVFLCMSKSA